jgi:hypothetical protein
METLKNFLWPIIAIGGLGAVIGFLIGKSKTAASILLAGAEVAWQTRNANNNPRARLDATGQFFADQPIDSTASDGCQ